LARRPFSVRVQGAYYGCRAPHAHSVAPCPLGKERLHIDAQMNGAWAERAEVERESHRLSLRNKEATAQAQGCVFQSGEETPRVCARRYTAFCWRFP